tara:strand:+ start:269 stop:442 length:174 start_codon:yes stop_codon:yes gene_type:complete
MGTLLIIVFLSFLLIIIRFLLIIIFSPWIYSEELLDEEQRVGIFDKMRNITNKKPKK